MYTPPHNPAYPVICMDETTKQWVKETRVPQPVAPGRPARYDAEYERTGVAHLLLYYAPLNWRWVDVKSDYTVVSSAQGVRRLLTEDFPRAERTTLVMDNLNTHGSASLYKAFPPQKARRPLEKLQFVYTPKHSSWLNKAGCELSVLARQCLNPRLSDTDTVRQETAAWRKHRNACTPPAQWRNRRCAHQSSQPVSGNITLKEHY